MMKRIIALLLCLMMSLGAFSAFAAGEEKKNTEQVTIAAGKKARAGKSFKKEDTKAKPQLDLKSISKGDVIRFWIYRNGRAQVSPTYKCKKQDNIPIDYNNSGNKKKGDLYHSVWRKHEQSIKHDTVTVECWFKP